jgi:N-methylhydantoinase A/oxoprolinase/acetone carboxylase beta subunit
MGHPPLGQRGDDARGQGGFHLSRPRSRDFALFAFGGNGGIHAAALARELGMASDRAARRRVFGAVGLLFTDHEVSRSAAWPPLADDAETLAAITRALARLDADVPGPNWARIRH